MPNQNLRQLGQSSFLRFAGVGALSTVLDFVVLNVLIFAGASVYLAGALGFFAGFTNGYLLNSQYVFKKASRSAYVKYFLVSLGGLGITELLLHLFHVEWGLGANVAKLIAVVVVFFWNYGLSKYWVFM
jgi:putative flippase GtrA